jgi:RimJ/RimL family protein N-acetyltransferase
VELAWVVATEHQGKGVATEAASAVIESLRSQGVTTSIAHISPDNAASAAVARRLGMSPTDQMVRGEVRWQATG